MRRPRSAQRHARLAAAGLLLALGACRAPFVPDTTGTTLPPPEAAPLLPFRLGGSGADFARAVATDGQGNAYVASYFTGTVDFDPSLTSATGRIAIGSYDIAVAKYDSTGALQWVNSIGGTDADVPFAIKLAPDGGVYVAGYVTSGAVCSGLALPNGGGHDVLLARFAPDGSCTWAVSVGSTGDDEAHDLLVESSGDVVITGTFSGTVDFDPGPGTGILISRGGTDGFVARYGSNGAFKSVVQFGGATDDAGNALAATIEGDIVVGGTFSGTATFGSALAPVVLNSVGGNDFFLARLAPGLGLEWAGAGGGSGDDAIGTGGVVVDQSDVIYATGTFSGTADVDLSHAARLLVSKGGTDVFLASYDGAGNFGGLAVEFGGDGNEGVSGFARDADGNFYLSGWFQSSVDFDPGAGTHVVDAQATSGAADGYVVSLTSGGDMRWVNPLSNAIAGSANVTIANGVSLTSGGAVWVVGRFFGRIDFDPGTSAVALQSLGDADQFVARYFQTTGAIWR